MGFKQGNDFGRRVFTPKGTGFIAGESEDQYKVELEDGGAELTMSKKVVRFKAINEGYRDKYQVDKEVKTASGAPTVSCGDDMAEALKGLGLAELEGVAKENDLHEKWAGWQHLNPGMRRMNLGNVLRGRIKKGTSVSVVGKVFKGDPVTPKTKAEKDKPATKTTKKKIGRKKAA